MLIRRLYHRRFTLRRSSGFTLIELTTVLLIVAIFSAISIPKFANLSDQAKQVVLKSHAASLQSIVFGAHYTWRIYGNGVSVGNMDEFGDGTCNFNTYGFPMECGDRIGNHPTNIEINASTCARLLNNLLEYSATVDNMSTALAGQHYYAVENGHYMVGVNSSRFCLYNSTALSGNGFSYDSHTGLVSRF